MTQSYVSHLYDVSRWLVPLGKCKSAYHNNPARSDDTIHVDVWVVVDKWPFPDNKFFIGRFPIGVAREVIAEIDQLINAAKALRGS